MLYTFHDVLRVRMMPTIACVALIICYFEMKCDLKGEIERDDLTLSGREFHALIHEIIV